MAEFQELKQEYDRVGLDRMEEELEGVEFGEYDVEDEVGFDELLGEVGVDTEPAGPAVESPEDADVRAAIQVATTPSDPEQDVYHVRLGIVEDEGVNNGQLVVEALRDAFDLLGTRPSEDQISLGQYDDHVDAVFGAEVGVVEIEAALEPVEEVSDAAITEVTHRFDVEPPKPEPEPEAEGAAGTAEATGTTGTAEAADVEPGDIDSEVLNAEGEIQDTRTEFQQMQRAFDQVGLDQLEDELEDVKFGEYDTEDEVGFDELLDEVESMEAEAERKAEAESAPARPTVEPPDDEAIASTIEAAKSPDVPDNDVFHVRLGIVETRDSDVNNGQLVVEALRDAFDLLGTQPTEPEIDRGEYGEHVDAAFASHVGVAEIEAALEPVEEVSDAAITEVTDRFDVEPPEPEPEVEAEAETTATDEPGTEAATGAAAGDDVNDPMAEFEKLKDEYDPVGIDQMEAELEGVEFGNTAPADELDFQELLEDVPSPEEADLGGTTVEEFGEPEPGTEEFGDVEVAEPGTEEFGDVGVAEPGTEEFGDVGVAEPGTEEFGDVEVAEQTEAGGFGDVETAEPEEGPSEGPDSAAADVRSISGIGANYAERLASAGVETVGDLVTTDPETLSTETNISDSHISEWIDRAPVEPADVGPTAEPESEPEPISAESEVGVGLGATEPEPEPEPERELDEIQSIRVDVDRIDELLNLVEGLVTSRTRLRRAVEQGADPETLLDEIEELDLISEEMQDHVVDMRLVPARSVTERLPRVVRDIARKQEKRVRFEVEGEGVEVDRSILNRVGDPLVHLIRNAVDHGIESPQEREASGKPAEGQITLQIRRRRDDVIIEVEDDGRGLDPDGLRGRAVEEGVLDEEVGKALSDKDAYQLIFESGFSMREEVTDVSGRGVGMNVVSNAVEELDGDIEIESEPDEGTTIRLVLPVSVAISEVIFLESGDEEYGVPIQVVDEIEDTATIEHLDDGQIRTPDGVVRELIDLHEALDVPGQAVADGGGGSMLVTVETDVRQAAIRCENVRGQQEVVVKPFEGLMSGIPGLSGAAVLGAGEVVNILDVETL